MKTSVTPTYNGERMKSKYLLLLHPINTFSHIAPLSQSSSSESGKQSDQNSIQDSDRTLTQLGTTTSTRAFNFCGLEKVLTGTAKVSLIQMTLKTCDSDSCQLIQIASPKSLRLARTQLNVCAFADHLARARTKNYGTDQAVSKRLKIRRKLCTIGIGRSITSGCFYDGLHVIECFPAGREEPSQDKAVKMRSRPSRAKVVIVISHEPTKLLINVAIKQTNAGERRRFSKSNRRPVSRLSPAVERTCEFAGPVSALALPAAAAGSGSSACCQCHTMDDAAR